MVMNRIFHLHIDYFHRDKLLQYHQSFQFLLLYRKYNRLIQQLLLIVNTQQPSLDKLGQLQVLI